MASFASSGVVGYESFQGGFGLIPIFVGYALMVWFAASRWRRRIMGIVSLTVFMTILLLIARVHSYYGTIYDISPEIFQGLLWPYIVLVGVIGFFIFLAPRQAAPGKCVCGYDTTSDGAPLTSCPECGRRLVVEAAADGSCGVCGVGLDPYAVEGECGSCGTSYVRSRTARTALRQRAEWGGVDVPTDAPRVAPRRS